MDTIIKYLTVGDLLLQCAEECNELAQACLKMTRKLEGNNPTPKTMEEITNDLNEEIADVLLCLGALDEADITNNQIIESIIMAKEDRWAKRILEDIR